MRFKNTFVAVSTAIFLVSAFAFTFDEPPYKNLQVLPKNISKGNMDSTMDHFNRALGVTCGYCHLQDKDQKWDYASDKKSEKSMARDMIKLTDTINYKFFHQETYKNVSIQVVTCYSCHRGKQMPVGTAPAFQQPKNPWGGANK